MLICTGEVRLPFGGRESLGTFSSHNHVTNRCFVHLVTLKEILTSNGISFTYLIAGLVKVTSKIFDDVRAMDDLLYSF